MKKASVSMVHMSEINPSLPPSDSSSELADKERTLWQAVSKYRKVVGYCLGLSSAVILYGYDQASMSVSSLPAFRRDFGERIDVRIILPSMWLGLWSFGSPIGVMVGAIFNGWLDDRFGRKISLAISSIITSMGVAIMFVCFASDEVATRRALFLAGKFAQGVGIGMILATTQTYMSEVLPPVLRGPVLSFFQIFTLLGQLIGAAVVYNSITLPGRRSYATYFAAQWPFSIATFIMSFLIPESPAYLVRKNRIDLAYKAQARLDEPNAHTASHIERLRQALAEERRTSTYKECFKGTNTRRSAIVIFASLIPQTFGSAFLAKASYFQQLVGMQAKMSAITVIFILALGLIASTGSFWIMSRFGRRPLIVYTLILSSVVWTSVGIAGCFSGKATNWYTAIGMGIVCIVSGLGAWPASCVVAAEASALHLRAKALGIGWFAIGLVAGIVGFVLPYMFNPDKGNLRAKIGFVYGGSTLTAALISWLIIPEMKSRSFDEIDDLFTQKVAARAFDKHIGPLARSA